MGDPAQIALFLVIIVLTILLLVLGVQIFLILKDFRKTIKKANKVLDDTGQITETVSGPLSNLSGLAAGIKTGISFINLFKKNKKNHKKEEEDNGE